MSPPKNRDSEIVLFIATDEKQNVSRT